MYVCMHACMYACMHVCMYACMHVCIYAGMYVCMHVRMYVCMYAGFPRPHCTFSQKTYNEVYENQASPRMLPIPRMSRAGERFLKIRR